MNQKLISQEETITYLAKSHFNTQVKLNPTDSSQEKSPVNQPVTREENEEEQFYYS